jgi:Skp family chaperone for outer membrane proteins
MKKPRDIEIFSLSFLDVICCAFGAIILLFVLSKFAEPIIIEEVREDLQLEVQRLEEELHEIRGETVVLNRQLVSKKEQLSEEKKRLARLQGDLSEIKGEFSASNQYAEVQNIIEGKLARALQELTEEMKRLLKKIPRKVARPSVGGIPVDSEYIIFIIDTSGSMQRNAWALVQRHPGYERHGHLYVFPIQGQMDTRHPRSPPGYYFQSEHLAVI